MSAFTEFFATLVEKYLGRSARAEDSISADRVTVAGERLGIAIPTALRVYYVTVGRIRAFNEIQNRVFQPEDLCVDVT